MIANIMSTPNYYTKNASRVFAVIPSSEYSEEDMNFFYENQIEIVQDLLEEMPYSSVYDEPEPCADAFRSYPGLILGCLSDARAYRGCPVGIFLVCIIRSGYYAGMNLDWEIHYSWGGEEQTTELDEEKILDEFLDHLPKSEAKDATERALKWFERRRKDMVSQLEAMYRKISIPLVCIGIFSNGEAVYEHERKKGYV